MIPPVIPTRQIHVVLSCLFSDGWECHLFCGFARLARGLLSALMASADDSPDKRVLTDLLLSGARFIARVSAEQAGALLPEEDRRLRRAHPETGAAIPPWATLGDQFSILEAELKQLEEELHAQETVTMKNLRFRDAGNAL